MIITKLIFYNFGVYAGKNVFEFNSSKPVVLIGGMNGRGKTTFLEGVLLALYGANSFAYSESKYSSYGQYLKSYINNSDGSLETYVELEFKLDNDNEKYTIKRTWNGKTQRIKEKIDVKKDDKSNVFLTDNWALFVENILPSGLSNFFFFDGEKIAELAVENTNAQMKESIKALLGISILDMLENDISKIVNKISKKSSDVQKTKELELLKNKKNQADLSLQLMDDKINKLTSDIGELNKKIEKAKVNYSSKGGDIITQQQDLLEQRTILKAKVQQSKENLLNIVGGELPLSLVKDLLVDIQIQSKKEHETRMLEYTVEKINEMFLKYSKNKSSDKSTIQNFISYVENTAKEDSSELIYNISDQSLFHLNNLIKNDLKKSRGNALISMGSAAKDNAKIDEIDSYLSVDIDEKSLSRIYKEIKTLEKDLINYEVELENCNKSRINLNGEAIRATSEYNKYVETLLQNLETNDDNERKTKYAYLATKILDEYKIRIQKQKTSILAETMTNCYKMLANKKNLIDKIIMDPVTLDLQYLSFTGDSVPKDSLSAGEKQLMVISLLWALAICSKKKLPVIIDTPLSRMDSVHRVALISTYFPKASEQTIILSTDSEIDRKYYDIMKINVGDEYTLVYDDLKKCSTIKKGYFLGDLS